MSLSLCFFFVIWDLEINDITSTRAPFTLSLFPYSIVNRCCCVHAMYKLKKKKKKKKENANSLKSRRIHIYTWAPISTDESIQCKCCTCHELWKLLQFQWKQGSHHLEKVDLPFHAPVSQQSVKTRRHSSTGLEFYVHQENDFTPKQSSSPYLLFPLCPPQIWC